MSKTVLIQRVRQLLLMDQNSVDIYSDLIHHVGSQATKNDLEVLMEDKKQHLRLLREILNLVGQ